MGMVGQKKKVRYGVELGGSYLDAITELIAIMRFRGVSTPLNSSCVPFEA